MALADARARGVELRVEGTHVRYRAPRGALNSALRRSLQQHGSEILALLRCDEGAALTPFDQLQLDWQAAQVRARSEFAAHGVEPDPESLRAAAWLDLRLAEGWETYRKGDTPAKARWIGEADARALLARIFRGSKARLAGNGYGFVVEKAGGAA